MQKLVFPDHFPFDGKGVRNEERTKICRYKAACPTVSKAYRQKDRVCE